MIGIREFKGWIGRKENDNGKGKGRESGLNHCTPLRLPVGKKKRKEKKRRNII